MVCKRTLQRGRKLASSCRSRVRPPQVRSRVGCRAESAQALGPSSGNPARICCRCITDEVRIRRSVPPDFQRVVLTCSQITSLAVQYRKYSRQTLKHSLDWSHSEPVGLVCRVSVSEGVALDTDVL